MREAVVLKGARGALQLIVDETAEFHSVFQQLKLKLENAAEFFASGMKINVPATDRFSEEEHYEIVQLLADYGLDCCITETEHKTVADEPRTGTNDYAGIGYEDQTLVVSRTLRGGQQVVYPGSVVVVGDVNPNAAVIAGGNIIIMGSCRGMAHAGAYGDSEATITAARLIAPQLRIAGMIARSPDNNPDRPEIETARIKDGNIVIERLKK